MKTMQELEGLLRNGRISRRNFITALSALGISASVSPLLLTKHARASTPKKGGRLRIGTPGGGTTDTLDPAIVNNFMQHISTFGLLRNCLVEIDNEGRAIPELAVSWEASSDAKTWVFKIRKGVEFHNGKTMDIQDVIYSLNYHRQEASKSAAKEIMGKVADLKADGPDTLVVTLKEGNADFAYHMSDYHLQIVPSETSNFDKGIGTGGYVLVDWKPGTRILTKRNPNYWKEDRAHFDEVEAILVDDAVARTNALTTGQIDVMPRPDYKTLDRLEKMPGVKITEIAGPGHYTIPMHCEMAPYDNKDARLALKYAIDREQWLKIVLRGHGTIGNDHPISPADRFFDASLEQRVYDPDKARFHLKKAGLEGHTFKLHAADTAFSGATDSALLYRESAKKAGIDIEVVREPNDGYWSNVYMKKTWCYSYWFGRPTADWVFSATYSDTTSWNESFWKHDRFNFLLKKARTELDDAKRQVMYAEMQRILRDEGGSVIPLFNNFILAASSKLKHDKVAGNMPLDGQRLPERWWFA